MWESPISPSSSAWDKSSHRIQNDDIEGAATHQGIDDLQGLLAAIGLGDDQIVHVHADAARESHVQGVLGVDKGRCPSRLLSLADDVQSNHRLARSLGAVYLYDPPPWNSPNSKGAIQGD